MASGGEEEEEDELDAMMRRRHKRFKKESLTEQAQQNLSNIRSTTSTKPKLSDIELEAPTSSPRMLPISQNLERGATHLRLILL
jgi:hypothetical protein